MFDNTDVPNLSSNITRLKVLEAKRSQKRIWVVIVKRIHQANVDLYNSPRLHATNAKSFKVQFREELVSFEPDSTDDDINSIESDQIEVPTVATLVDYKETIKTAINIFNIEEEVEEYEVEEEVIEEVQSDSEEGVKHIEHVSKSELNPEPELGPCVSNTATDLPSKRSRKKNKSSRRHNENFLNPREIHCKDHCIDKLDFDLSVSVKKLEIHDNVSLPPLQLRQRRCCDEFNRKFHRNLPNYKGLRSEYGLSSRQLDKKEKQAEIMQTREQTRRKLLEEYRQRRIQQNEEVFVQWLRQVAKRNSESQGVKTQKPANSKKRVSSGAKAAEATKRVKARVRPKTSKEPARKPSSAIKKKRRSRPHTAHSCVCIEVPESVLKEGLSLGDLTISSSKASTRKLHILTVS
ncbi:hypothetical protein NQ318_007886 [Aromia moschata]|uniref:Coiled-coil domain-containing protein 181 n=1 Tax=Aromia moschata TaxID=1265417 RepID=A0AAV8XQS4_9CUCU|nr:hypothetical protein NQ318_007886 [Aromia moschata]